MGLKKRLANCLAKLGVAMVMAIAMGTTVFACGSYFYQPKMPEVLKKK